MTGSIGPASDGHGSIGTPFTSRAATDETSTAPAPTVPATTGPAATDAAGPGRTATTGAVTGGTITGDIVTGSTITGDIVTVTSDIVTSDTAPVTTAPVTTAPVTTAPVTTAPVTTAPVTTAPVTTAPVTTAPATTAPATTDAAGPGRTDTDRAVASDTFAGRAFTDEGAIGVVGAGTMGAGIAQVAAVAGRRVLLTDAFPGAAEAAVAAIRDRVAAQVAKGRLTIDPAALDLTPVAAPADLADCAVVIEAIVEDLDVKRTLFAELESVIAADAILASNTSSLSPTALAVGLTRPERLVGLHFFNPVPAMKLVEVISGLYTDPKVADAAADLAAAWGKTVVRSTATPGFIVNRIARPYYAEAWRLYEEHAAAPETIDAVLTGGGGFRMGPFALMDLVGHDVNLTVTRTIWAAFGNDPRFAPALAQRALVDAGWLGRKSGRGMYPAGIAPAPVPARAALPPLAVIKHPPHPAPPAAPLHVLLDRAGVSTITGDRDDTDAGLPDGLIELPSGALMVQCEGVTATALATAFERPVIVVDRVLDPGTATAIAIAPSDSCPPQPLSEATGLLQAVGLAVYVIEDTPGLIVTRTVAMLANLAADALASQVASEPDIDTAMRLGVNYPQGPLTWLRQWGTPTILHILDALNDWYRDAHYRPAPLLRRTALAQQPPSPANPESR
jgi:3-hydroxybutyryl-CoA dehydrogenase